MQTMTTMTAENPAVAIATELRAVVAPETMRSYVSDESGYDSLEQYRSLVAQRLGGDYVASAWDGAMDLLRAAP